MSKHAVRDPRLNPLMAGDPEHWAKQGALSMARAVEMDRRREEIESVRMPQPFELLPAPEFYDRDTGRPILTPHAPLVYVGRYFRRSRAYAGMSQSQLAGKADVSQSMVSRVERARAPGMAVDRFVDMCLVLGRLFSVWRVPARPPVWLAANSAARSA